MGKRIKVRECRSCKSKYVSPTNWAGCCSELCLMKRLDFLEIRNESNNQKKPKKPIVPAFNIRSERWLKLRYEMIKKHGRTCMACGRKAPEVVIQIDHIKPRSKHPELTWEVNNLQVLCIDCNRGKSDLDETDFR